MTTNEQPLTGVNILVTRAAHQAKEFSAKLSKLGATVMEMPLVEFTAPDSWEELDLSITRINAYDWIIFASSNAVRSFVERLAVLKGTGTACPDLAQIKARIAVIGESTAKAAHKAGLTAIFQPDSFIAEDFVANFPGYPNLSGVKILWPRTNIGRAYIEEQLAQAGASIDIAGAYKTCLPQDISVLSDQLQNIVKHKKINVITLASKQTAINLASIIRDKHMLDSILILSIGPETSSGAKEYLGKVDLEANPHTTDGMIQKLVEHFNK
jgi:uroporphyrinogen-III synthase